MSEVGVDAWEASKKFVHETAQRHNTGHAEQHRPMVG